jgi:hypothetical protein
MGTGANSSVWPLNRRDGLGWAVLALAVVSGFDCAAADGTSEAELLEALGAIGYVAGSDSAQGPSGVVIHDHAAAQTGANLMTSGHAPIALLMDMQGAIVHTWSAEFRTVFPDHPKSVAPRRNFWRIARMLSNGELVVIWELYGLFKLDRDSNVVWAIPSHPHHDLQITADGRIHHLEAARRFIPEIPGKRSIEDFIVERDAEGKELHRVAISDALRDIDWPELRRVFWQRNRVRGYGLRAKGQFDPFHTNALHILSTTEAERLGAPFRPADVLVSMAMLDTIAVVDPLAAKVRWWQQGPFGMQHQPRVAPDGKIVVFNNFQSPKRSAVQVFDPRNHEVSWEYSGTDSEPLYSKRSGGAEFLPSGNLLIVETDRGRAIEVSPDKRVVWEFRSPYRVGTQRDRVAAIPSMQRVGESELGWLEP